MTPGPWTLIHLLNSASDYLDQQGIDNPRGNAEALLGKTLSLPSIELYLQHDRPLAEPEVTEFRELVKRRLKHEPLQQILGHVEFLDCRIDVPRGLLVPRPETEEWCRCCVESLSAMGRSDLRLLDVGCGTGCLSVAIARLIDGVRVDAIDLDPKAVACTERNAAANEVAERVRGIQGDLMADTFLDTVAPPYDVLVSNPPYVREAELESLAPEILGYESPHALLGGGDGLDFYRRLAELIPALLHPHGRGFLEIGIGQAEEVRGLLDAVCTELRVHEDLSGIPRMLEFRVRES